MKAQGSTARVRACGFKAGQSPRGRIGYRVECAQTIAAGMSAIEPTVVMSFPPMKKMRDESFPLLP